MTPPPEYQHSFNNLLAVIPARGGSKGIPKKNISDLNGKPLVAYSIEAALNSKYVNRVVVWTDSAEIAEVSKGYGAEIPFLRQPDLATDKASLYEAIFNLYDELYKRDKYESSIYLVLFPTYPFKTGPDIDRLLEDVFDLTYVSYFVSPSSFQSTNSFLIKNNQMTPLKKMMSEEISNQTFYKSNNSVIARMQPRWRYFAGMTFHEQFRALQDFYKCLVGNGIVRKQKIAYELSDGMRTLDIDFHDQLLLARKIMEHNLFDFDSCFDDAYAN